MIIYRYAVHVPMMYRTYPNAVQYMYTCMYMCYVPYTWYL